MRKPQKAIDVHKNSAYAIIVNSAQIAEIIISPDLFHQFFP